MGDSGHALGKTPRAMVTCIVLVSEAKGLRTEALIIHGSVILAGTLQRRVCFKPVSPTPRKRLIVSVYSSKQWPAVSEMMGRDADLIVMP